MGESLPRHAWPSRLMTPHAKRHANRPGHPRPPPPAPLLPNSAPTQAPTGPPPTIRMSYHPSSGPAPDSHSRTGNPRANRGEGPPNPALTLARALFAGGARSNISKPRLRNSPAPGRELPNNLTSPSVKRTTPQIGRTPRSETTEQLRRAHVAPPRWQSPLQAWPHLSTRG